MSLNILDASEMIEGLIFVVVFLLLAADPINCSEGTCTVIYRQCFVSARGISKLFLEKLMSL
jgi:hypothetical protein